MLRNKVSAIFVISLLIFTVKLQSQININSPFSRYGLGIVEESSLNQNKALGTSGVGYRDAKHINFQNPASYGVLDSMAFLFETGVHSDFMRFTEDTLSDRGFSGGLGYISMAFPITKWWGSALGVLPFSRVGYTLTKKSDLYSYNYSGDGGQNKLVWGNAFDPLPFLSIGFNTCYIFGETYYQSETKFNVGYFNTLKAQTTKITGLYFETGLLLHHEIYKNATLALGFTFAPAQNLKSNSTNIIASVDSATQINVFSDEKLTSGDVQIPMKMGYGISYVLKNKLLVTAEYTMQDWTGIKSNSASENNLKNETKISGGIEIIPNIYAPRGYFNKIAYRIGGYYKNTYIQLQEEVNGAYLPLKDFGMSFGVECPFRKTRNSISVAASVGKKYTNSEKLLRENYIMLDFNITLRETWFVKAKID
ncbi:MAG: hypothetical protein IPO21_07385 [Bacteroidales bacterium]|nr:hypothetical protein [Bacteroidales bacterium]